MMKKLLWILLILLFLISHGCDDRFQDRDDNICGQDPCYEGPFEPPWLSAHDEGLEFVDENWHTLTCDNRVLETENVLTFSDASGDEVKIEYARMTEVSFAEIKVLFDIATSAELGIVDRHTKMTIYSNRYTSHRQNSKYNGFILDGLDNPHWGNSDDPDFRAWYQRMVKHETTHVVEYYYTGAKGRTHEWFNEGLAEHVSGGDFETITTWEQVEAWRQSPDHVNPITIYFTFPVDWTRVGEYYPMFHLAVQYLMDPRGRGRTYSDVKALFQAIGDENLSFSEAFERHMGLSELEYEARFYEWMEAYLPAN
jgi:hypothetical protein